MSNANQSFEVVGYFEGAECSFGRADSKDAAEAKVERVRAECGPEWTVEAVER